jgi:hypothetical protein
MASPYTANKDAVQAPAPAPAPNATLVISIPAGSEVRTIESITQQMKVEADYIDHAFKSLHPDVAVVNAAGTGFTAPAYTSFGGTVTPSSSAHIADGTRFMLKIIAGGAVGVATFQTSMDGGNTYGATQTTAASMTDATSGITLAFVGTLTINGTASFRSAFTPLAEWRDAAGNTRSFIDHNGYYRGRRNEFYEDWMSLSRWTTVANNGTASFLSAASSRPGGAIDLAYTSAVAGNNLTLITPLCVGFLNAMSLVMEFEVSPPAAGNHNWLIGMASAASGTLSSANQVCAVGRQGSGTYKLCTANGSINNSADSGVTPSAPGTLDRVTLELHGSASPYGAKARLFVNDNLAVESTTALPNASMGFMVGGTATGAVAFAELMVSPMRAIWNRVITFPVI